MSVYVFVCWQQIRDGLRAVMSLSPNPETRQIMITPQHQNPDYIKQQVDEVDLQLAVTTTHTTSQNTTVCVYVCVCVFECLGW